MLPEKYTVEQEKVLSAPLEGSLFIEGSARTGKTTAVLARLEKTLSEFPGYQVLILTPQQSLARPYRDFMKTDQVINCGIPRITTISGIARDLLHIFWPEVKNIFNFAKNASEPIFLSLESAQYCMSRIVDPLLEKGYFQTIKIEKHRLYSQIIDNLNKSAIHGLSLESIPTRLLSGTADPSILGNAFQQVSECALSFRNFCLENNLVDFSLLMHIARTYLFARELPLKFLHARYRVLIADNIEEDTPIAHDFYRTQTPYFNTASLIFDHHGGFRTFLGADAENAYTLKSICDQSITLTEQVESYPEMDTFRVGLLACIDKRADQPPRFKLPDQVQLSVYQFLPEMISGVVSRVETLVANGVQPSEIAVLSPYLSDVLKYSISEKLAEKRINLQTSRPSRKYLASSSIKAILTLACIAHPDWGLPISHYEFRDCLMRLVRDMDIIRADHAARALLGKKDDGQVFRSFDALTNLSLQETITFAIGEKLALLSAWMTDYFENGVAPLDIFLQRLFGEVLSQPSFALHTDLDAANDISRIIRSIRLFRSFSSTVFDLQEPSFGKAYIKSIQQGLLPSAFSGIEPDVQGVLISPAHTFLMQNRSVAYQFWLDIGSLGWWERLYQPLTNPYVYQKRWGQETAWNENREFAVNQAMMGKLINGLLLRCQQGVFASVVNTNEYGAQNSGPLLKAFQKMVKKDRKIGLEEDHV